jgi:hypothetical protein
MGLDLWFREDVARILASTQETMEASQAATVINEDYQLGFRNALRAVAVAFGVAPPSQWPAGGLPAPKSRVQVIEHNRWG